MTMKRYPLLALILLSVLTSSFQLHAQFEINGKVISSEDAEILQGAHVFLYEASGSLEKITTTDDQGTFVFDRIATGKYRLKISFVGFRDLERAIDLNGNMALGNITLQFEKKIIDELDVIGKVPAATLSGDTLEFNADAYKTMPDASATDLAEKLPGVVIEDNKVQAQGEDVKEVLVDGRPFFGQNPNATLNALPAEVVEKIQIFDKESDQAEFTGFSTGETTKTMNIITRARMQNGSFGKVYSGFGYPDKYIVNGNYNIFNGEQRITIVGLTNNINQQNFAIEDLLGIMAGGGRRSPMGRGAGGGGRGGGSRGGAGGMMGGGDIRDFMVSQQGGITQTHAGGMNYSDLWGEKFDITASYYFNLSDNITEETLYRQYLLSADSGQVYDENNTSDSRNINHRFRGKIDYTLNENNSFLWRPSLSLQQNDGMAAFQGTTILEDAMVNDIANQNASELSALNLNNSILYRHRFGKQGRTFSIQFNNSFNETRGDKFLENTTQYFVPVFSEDLLDQNALLISDGWGVNSRIVYTEPAGETGLLQFSYNVGYQENQSDQQTYNFDQATSAYILFDTLLSNTFSNDYTTHRMGSSYNFRKNSIFLMLGVDYQYASLSNQQEFPASFSLDNSYNNILFNGMLRIGNTRQNSLNIRYNTGTRNPSLSQLQDVIDNSDPLQITTGNPELDQSYSHRLFLRYSDVDTEKSRVFFAMIGGEFQQDYIGNRVILARSDIRLDNGYVLKEGTQLTSPLNLDGYYNLRSFITYGIPLEFIKSNLNFNVSGMYSRTPGLVDETVNYSSTTNGGLGLVLSSNISEFVDFTLSSQSNYNVVQNTQSVQQNTTYFNQRTRLRFKWVFLDGWLVEMNGYHQFYSGLSEALDQSYYILNASIGRKLFKNQLGEIKLTGFDLLNQNQSLNRTVSDIYIEDSETLVLQRFFMVTFTYNIRRFDGNLPERPAFGPPPGMPEGMRPGRRDGMN